MIAAPWPTPTHMVARPYLPPRCFNSCSRVADIRAPLQPSGWPIAMTPPFTFTLAASSPNILELAIPTTEKASLNSKKSTSSLEIPALSNA